VLPIVAVAILVNILPTRMALARRHDVEARMAAGVLAAVYPALSVYLLAGHQWQMDGHMYFFVALAALTVLCDWRPLVLASALIAVHHLLLEYVAPEWVFTGAGNFGRVVFHAVAVVLQCAVLSYVTTRLRALMEGQEGAMRRSEIAARDAVAARDEAQQALATARIAEERATIERSRRQALEHNASEQRRQAFTAMADEFKASVASIVDGVATAAEQLETSARALSGLARNSSRQSIDVAASASQASNSADDLARNIRDLSASIGDIATSVHRQSELAASARALSQSGDTAVSTLGRRSADIEDFTGQIGQIASRTNLLALNAAIEAARAGAVGRSFAVVADEVESLAGQAAQASSAIRAMIGSMQDGAGVAGGALRDMTDVVGALAGAADAIRNAIEHQRATTAAIEANAQETARGADAMAGRIAEVAGIANDTERLSTEVQGAAGRLMETAAALRNATDGFVTRLVAA